MNAEACALALEYCRSIEARLDSIEACFSDMQSHMDPIERHIGLIGAQIGSVRGKQPGIRSGIARIGRCLDGIQGHLTRIEKRLDLAPA